MFQEIITPVSKTDNNVLRLDGIDEILYCSESIIMMFASSLESAS